MSAEKLAIKLKFTLKTYIKKKRNRKHIIKILKRVSWEFT